MDTKEETEMRARGEALMAEASNVKKMLKQETAQLTCAPSAPQPDGDDDGDDPKDDDSKELPQVPEHPQGDEGRRSCFEGGRQGMQSIRCQFCDRTSTMFSVFIYVESERSEELASRGEYPYTWHPAKVQDPAFQAALNLQRGRQVEEDTRKKEGIVSKMKADGDARSVALMCFMCAEEWLRDYRIRAGGSRLRGPHVQVLHKTRMEEPGQAI
eukprot:4365853-Amphidinium_carterae.2